MYSERSEVNAFLPELLHHLRREMQSRRGRRHRAVMGGIDRLVVRQILDVRSPAAGDIGGQRHSPYSADGTVQALPTLLKNQIHLSPIAGQDMGPQIRGEIQPVSGLEPPGGLCKGQVAVRTSALVKGNLDRNLQPFWRPGRPHPAKPGWNYPT